MQHTKKTLLILVLLNMVVLAIYSGVFLYIRSMNLQVSNISSEIETLRDREEKGLALKAIILETEAERARLVQHIFSKDNLVPFIEFIENLARRSGVGLTLRSADLEEGLTAVAAGLFRMDVEVGGTWNEVFQFTALLGSIPYKVEFADIMVETTGSSDGERSWRGSYKMTIPTL
ncbi:MAG: hypothetical protein Q7S15_01280 [bacterium]|nr:hypothetical protein [bacterium]